MSCYDEDVYYDGEADGGGDDYDGDDHDDDDDDHDNDDVMGLVIASDILEGGGR